MLGINKGSDTAVPLCLGNGVDSQRGLTRGFGTIDFNDTSLGITAHSEGSVEGNTARGNHFDFFDLLIAHLHDGAFAKVFFNLEHRSLKGFELLAICVCGDFFFCHIILLCDKQGRNV